MAVGEEPSGMWACLLRLRVALVLTFVQLCFSGYAIVSQSVLHKSSSGSGSGATEGKALNPAVFIVCRDVGCSIVLLLAGRIQAGKFLWPDPQDRFLFVLIGICNVSPHSRSNARGTPPQRGQPATDTVGSRGARRRCTSGSTSS
jgi:hypothetical protein